MSGPQIPAGNSAASPLAEQASIVANVRRLSGVPAGGAGPDDTHVFAAVREFAGQFNHWYTRVMAKAVAQYRKLIVMRINPFIRRIECDGLDCISTP